MGETMNEALNIIAISGGKDSTAMALLAIERETPDLRFVFADTGHEHSITYEYVEYLSEQLERLCGRGIDIVKADFSKQIYRKRRVVATKWKKEGVSREIINNALSVLKPTGNPFLDLCIWKGRFPSTRARFCSEELKHKPMAEYTNLVAEGYVAVISWQGVRADESPSRAGLPMHDIELGEWEPIPRGRLIYRPIIHWAADECFAQHKKHKIKWNPLYELGMGRVGCMPCIHTTKREMREIARRFPEELKRVAEWERICSLASKKQSSIFMDARVTAGYLGTTTDSIDHATHGINTYVQWAMTERGGRQHSLIHLVEHQDVPTCSSIYGLCE